MFWPIGHQELKKGEEEVVVVAVATPEARLTCVKLQRGAEERKFLEWRFISTELRLQQRGAEKILLTQSQHKKSTKHRAEERKLGVEIQY